MIAVKEEPSILPRRRRKAWFVMFAGRRRREPRGYTGGFERAPKQISD
jgi:hypothetical protein